MTGDRFLASIRIAMAVFIVVAVGLAVYAVFRLETLTRQPDSFRLDLSGQLRIAPERIGYRQISELPLELMAVHALAVGPEDRIFVAGDREVRVLTPDGQLQQTIALAGSPTCIAVGSEDHVSPGRIYVGGNGRVEVFTPQGEVVAVWDGPGPESTPTSITLGIEDIFVADAANRLVLRFDPEGQILSRIGGTSAGQSGPGFIIPSPYFDVVCGPEGWLHAVNPGTRRIETYTYSGELQTVWGKAGSGLDGFFGCCNPAHLARLPDGSFVTSEKGIPRIKVYDESGSLLCAVAGPVDLGVPESALGDPSLTDKKYVFEVATDSNGRVLVLDPVRMSIRVFVRQADESDENHDATRVS
jgi:hypothetical protein